MDDAGTMDDVTTTEAGWGGETMDSGAGTTADDGMVAEDEETTMGDETETTTDGEETASDGQPGLGLVVGILALLATAVVAFRRRSELRVDLP